MKINLALIQRLESLERAGVTHLPNIPLLKAKTGLSTERTGISPKQVSPVAKSAFATPPPPTLQKTSTPPKTLPPKTLPKPETAKPEMNEKQLPSLKIIEQLEQSDDARCRALAEVAREVAKCRRCQELAETRTQTVFGTGNPYATLVFCGEAPGADEDRLGEPFVGRAGQLLTDIIEKGMKIRRQDVYILNILRCRPPGNRNPLPVEATSCREYLERQLEIIQPQYICCLGAVAAQNLLQRDDSIGQLRGVLHDLNGIKVLCTYHPAYLLRNPPAKKYVWDDIQILMAEMGLKK
jgi:uracil-DNA glycosylase